MSSNLFLLIGEDKSLIDFNVFNILNNISYDDNNKIIYDLNFDNFMDVMEEASMVSLFSPIKVIIVNNFVIDNLNDYELDYLSKYINGNNKSPSWSGVQFLHNFLTRNKGVGPYGKIVSKNEVQIGDVAQLSFDGYTFGHTLVIVNIEEIGNLNKIGIASHTMDNFYK